MQTVKAGSATIDFAAREARFADGKVVSWGRDLVANEQVLTADSPRDVLEHAVRGLREVAEQHQQAQADLAFMFERGHLPGVDRAADGSLKIPGDITVAPAAYGRPRSVIVTLEDRKVVCQRSVTGGRAVRTIMHGQAPEGPEPRDVTLAKFMPMTPLALRVMRSQEQQAFDGLTHVEYERGSETLAALRAPGASDAQRAVNVALDHFAVHPSTDRYAPGVDDVVRDTASSLKARVSHPDFVQFARTVAMRTFDAKAAIGALKAGAADPALAEETQALRDYLVLALHSLDGWERNTALKALAHDDDLPSWAKGAVVLSELRDRASSMFQGSQLIEPEIANRMLKAAAAPEVQERIATVERDGRLGGSRDAAIDAAWRSCVTAPL